MAIPFPYADRKIESGCVYMSTNDLHTQMLADLDRSVVVHTSNADEEAEQFTNRVRLYLLDIFGGTMDDFSYLKTTDISCIIKVPNRLTREQVVNDGNSWGNCRGYWFDFWNIERASNIHSSPFRVKISILHFPLFFWHPTFITNVVSEFGEVESIDEVNVTGADRSVLNLWITCLDVKRIPQSTILPFGIRWTQCIIRISQWEYTGWVPPEARLTERDGSPFRLTGTFAQARWSLMRASERILYHISNREATPPSSDSSASDSMGQNNHHSKVPTTTPAVQSHPLSSTHDNLSNTPHPTSSEKIVVLNSNSVLQIGQFLLPVPEISHTNHNPNDQGKYKEWLDGDWGRDEQVTCLHTIQVGQISVLHIGQVLQCTLHPETITTQVAKNSVKHSTRSSCDEMASKCKLIQKTPHTTDIFNFIQHQPNQPKKPIMRIKCNITNVEKTAQAINAADGVESTLSLLTTQTAPHTQNPENNPKSKMASSDEQFIASFAALSSSNAHKEIIQVPLHNTQQRDWPRCGLLRIVTDKTIQDAQFPFNMTRIWSAQPETTFSMIGLNMYLVQFTSEQELLRIMHRGVWTYRTEVVAIQRITGPEDLIRPSVNNLEVWVQWHGIPIEAITKEGLLEISTTVGRPRSEVYEAFTNGIKYYRIKMMIPADAALKPCLNITHPHLGVFNIYCVYEKLVRVCLFCAKIGHDRLDCPDHIRMERLREDPRFANSPQLDAIPAVLVGSWINNQSLVPKLTSPYHHTMPNYSNHNSQLPPNTTTAHPPISPIHTGTQQTPLIFQGTTSGLQQTKRYMGSHQTKRYGDGNLQVVRVRDPEECLNCDEVMEDNTHVHKKRALEVSQSPPPHQ